MDIAEQIYGAIDILVNNKIKSINFNTTIDGTIVDASRAKEGRYRVQDETARSFIAYSNQTDYKENDNVLITIPNGDYTEQKIIVGKKVGNVENTSFKYTSPLSTMIPLVRCTLSGSQREQPMYANQNETMICPILKQDFSQNPLIGYTRIGLTADFSTWLKELNTVEGSYGIVCTCAFAKNGLAGENEVTYELDSDIRTVATNFITDTTNSTDNNIEFVNFLLDSATDFYGDVYNFQDYFAQEAVFDISRFADQKLLYVLVSFYQRQDFKDNKGNYIPAPTFDSQKLKIALLNYKNNIADNLSAPDLSSYYALDGKNGLSTIISVDKDFISAMPNLYVREPQVILGYNLGDFENDSSFLFSQSSHTYNTTKTDEENKKLIELRWVHDFSGTIKDVTKNDFWNSNLKDYNIRWYRRKLGAPSPDQYTGVYWELLKSYQYTSGAGDIDDLIFQLEIIPDTSLDYEEFKVIIVKNYSIISESNAIIFENEQSTENMTQTDKNNALSIACGHPKIGEDIASPEDRFYKDAYQGMFFIYKKGNQLIDDSKALEKLFLTPVFNSVKTDYEPDENSEYNAGDITILSDAQVIIWSFPASHTMLRPIAKTSASSNETFILASEAPSALINYNDYPYFENTNCKRSLIISYTTRNVNTKIFYNRTLDTLEFVHILSNGVPDGQVDLSLDDCGIIQPYYIAKTYTPSAVNNTVGLEVIKDRIRYSTSKTMYFGQAGTSGSDYTLVVNFKNNQNAVCIQEDENGYAADYFGEGLDTYNALIASVRLIGQDGKDVIDFNNRSEENDAYTVDFSIEESQIAGYTGEDYRTTPKEKSSLFYPVVFTGQSARTGADKAYQNYSEIADDGLDIAEYAIQDGNWSDERTDEEWSQYYYFSLDTANDNDTEGSSVPVTTGTFTRLTTSPVAQDNQKYYQYYRRLTGNEVPKDKITYKLYKDENGEDMDAEKYANLTGPLFINYSGVYVLDPFFDNTGYNEAQDYYYPVLVEKNVDAHSVLTIERDTYDNITFNPINECLIHLNNEYWASNNPDQWTVECPRPSAAAVMRSVTILKVTLSGFGDYDLITYVPIPLRRVLYETNGQTSEIKNWVQSIVGATEIRYSSSGEVPDYYKNPYIANVRNNGTIQTNESNNWEIICPLGNNDNANFQASLKEYPENSPEKCILNPLSIYIPNAPLFGVAFKLEDEILWSQPILVYQDNYPSSTINAWDGKSITTDDGTGSILSSAIAAGKKTNNKFSGVMLGDWSRSDTDASVSKQTGLYGFHEGGMSFAFKEDGTAFIGKDGYGRIHLAGNKAQIYSQSWILGQQGMLLDLNKGSMKLVQKSKYSAKSFTNKAAYDAFLSNNSNSSLYRFLTYCPFQDGSNITNFYIPNELIIQSISVLDKNLQIPNFYYYFYYTITENILIEQNNNHQAGSFNDEDAPELINNSVKITYMTCTRNIKCKRDAKSNQLVEDPEGTITCYKIEKTTIYKVMIMREQNLTTIQDLQDRLGKMTNPEEAEYVGTQNVSVRVAKNYKSLTKDIEYTYQLPNSENNYQVSSMQRSYTSFGNKPVFSFFSDYIKISADTAHTYPNQDMYVPYNPNFTYYTKDETASSFGDARYVTVSAAETIYPLAIGAQESVGQRPFRVRWDGNVYIEDGVFTGTITATGGAITGDLDVTGTLTGGTFITDELYAAQGTIGGWIISSNTLKSADGNTILSTSSPNITTNTIAIEATGKHNLGGKPLTGKLGYVEGHADQGATDAMGYITEGRALILGVETVNENTGNIGIRTAEDIYISAGRPVNADETVEGSGEIVLYNKPESIAANAREIPDDQGGVTINGNYLKVNVSAEHQTGIYARFA